MVQGGIVPKGSPPPASVSLAERWSFPPGQTGIVRPPEKYIDILHRMNVSPSRDREGHGADERPSLVRLSVVVPCFDEEAVISETHRRLVIVLEDVPDLDFEIIYVDDGSRDATLALLRGFQQADPRVRILSLSRNFGHNIALTAGLAEAFSGGGDVMIVIDADLQDPTELIPGMLERWRQGADVVYGRRIERDGETTGKLWTAKVFYRLFARISNTPIPLDTGNFRLMSRKAVDGFLAMPERDRFMRGMVAWSGFRQEPVFYRRHARWAGRTKYSSRKMLGEAMNAILSFSLLPLRLAAWVGFFVVGLALSGIVYALAVRISTDAWVSGWAALFIAILFLGGVQLVFIGVLGEYLGRIYAEVKRRPLYLVKERLGFASTGSTGHLRPGAANHPAARGEAGTRC